MGVTGVRWDSLGRAGFSSVIANVSHCHSCNLKFISLYMLFLLVESNESKLMMVNFILIVWIWSQTKYKQLGSIVV